MTEVPRSALEEAHLPTLLVTLAHLTGDPAWISGDNRPKRPRPGSDPHDGGLPEPVRERVLTTAKTTLEALLSGDRPMAPHPSPDAITEMLSASLGTAGLIDHRYAQMAAEELGVLPRHNHAPRRRTDENVNVIIIGAGFSGLCAAIAMQRAGITFEVLERNASIGGTWISNTYPGAGVDTPSHLYSYSFTQNASWPGYFASGEEVRRYLERVATDHHLLPHIRFGVNVSEAAYNGSGRWVLSTVDAGGVTGVKEANVLLSGVGFFNEPSRPSIPGLETFAGPVLHTAAWDATATLADRRIGVIGTGASAMQLVPRLADEARKLTVFQRSPQWALPQENTGRAVSAGTRWLMEQVPFYLGWFRLRLLWVFGDALHPALQVDERWPHPERSVNEINDRHRQFLTDYIRSELGERADDLSDKCIPTYPPYGKRPLLDHGWFRTMARDDVELVTNSIAEVRGNRVVMTSGEEHELDVLVLATGFHARNVLGTTTIIGRSGQTLREFWGEDDAHAYLGMAVPEFPNFFILLGPNTFPAHGGSAVFTIEQAVSYVTQIVVHLVETGATELEVRPDVHRAYLDEIDADLSRSIWAHPGMTTYYRNGAGRIVIPMPWTSLEYWERTHRPHFSDYHVRG